MIHLRQAVSILLAIFLITACGDDNSTGPDLDEDAPETGTLEISTHTTGDDVDTDGYTLTVDGSQNSPIQISTTIYIDSLEKGYHNIGLTGISQNCTPETENPKDIAVFADDTTSFSFSLSCLEVANNKIVYHSNRDGDYDIYMMNPDGSQLTQLTSNFDDDKYPVFSKNGTQISFVRDEGNTAKLMAMHVDGSNLRTLTAAASFSQFTSDDHPVSSWSPDNSEIVFGRNRTINKIMSDGSNETEINGDAKEPSWSHDGTQIAYIGNYTELMVMDTDGSNQSTIAGQSGMPDSSNVPRWAPGGSKLAASVLIDGYKDIYTINANGSSYQNLTNEDGSDETFPSWSPDGSRLVFQSDRFGDSEIYIIDADGSSSSWDLITSNNADDGAPHWSPVE